jgi:hypothetical protein
MESRLLVSVLGAISVWEIDDWIDREALGVNIGLL